MAGQIIYDGEVWSFSRLSAYEACPYQFFLKYVVPQSKKQLFFASYGSHVHNVLAEFYSGKTDAETAVQRYLVGFDREVKGRAPSSDIRIGYFKSGLEHIRQLKLPSANILGVEKRMEFSLGDFAFLGFADLVLEGQNGEIYVVDHKSRMLKPRSKRAKPTASDKELDKYLRQLYMYAIPISKEYGRTPSKLAFNCYRSGQVIVEPFCTRALEDAKRWAMDLIHEIIREDAWSPHVDYFRCNYLCDVCDSCEFFDIEFGSKVRST